MDYITKYQIEALKVLDRGCKVYLNISGGKAVMATDGADCIAFPVDRLLVNPEKCKTWNITLTALEVVKNTGWLAHVTGESKDWYSDKTKSTVRLRKVVIPESDTEKWFNEKRLKKIPAKSWVLHENLMVAQDADGKIMGGVMAVNVKVLKEV